MCPTFVDFLLMETDTCPPVPVATANSLCFGDCTAVNFPDLSEGDATTNWSSFYDRCNDTEYK